MPTLILCQGAIVPGNDADFVVWEPDVEFDLNENHTIYHKHPVCFSLLHISQNMLQKKKIALK